jgi:carboxyl-terminal processing protease
MKHRAMKITVVAALAAVLAGCGGGDDGGDGFGGSSCSITAQKDWLSGYMFDQYFWYRLSPRPNPAGFDSAESYYRALLYTGTSSTFPSDRWSSSQSTESFNRFFGDGATMGYGVSVAALELERDSRLPLFVRYVEPRSPAAAQDLRRGDQVITINGRAVADLIAADDFAALSAGQVGDTLTLVLRRAGVDRTVTLRAEVFNLTPVSGTEVFRTPDGRLFGYVAVKDMISQSLAPMETAFARFKREGVQDVVIDLRYNGGGLVSAGGTLASYIAGLRGNGLSYATLLYNDKQTSRNENFRFASLGSALGTPRVFVLVGRRTCSASEQVINGLRGAGVEVVAIGETTCGKPVGSVPTSACGTTYSAINFESVNQRNEGRYFDGFAPTCAVPEDFTAAQGSGADPLVFAASEAIDTGFCPAVAGSLATKQALAKRPASARGVRVVNEGDGPPVLINR